MINKRDCWISETFDKSFGPRAQWTALRKLYKEMDITDEDAEWLDQTTVSEVDGRMAQLLEGWHYARQKEKQSTKKAVAVSNGAVSADPIMNASSVIAELFSDIDAEIAQIKNGTLATNKANEVAKFRTMQIRSMELILQAGHLEVKLRGMKK